MKSKNMIVLCAVLGMLGMQALLPTNMTETFQAMPLLAHAEEEEIENIPLGEAVERI